MEQPQQAAAPRGDAALNKDNKSKSRRNAIVWLLAVLVVLLLAGAGYLWWQLQACKKAEQQLNIDKQQLQEQVDALKKQASTSPDKTEDKQACNDTPSDTMKENIKAALDSKNTAAFATYTTNPVGYVLAASEYGGAFSPDEAALALEYTHSATGPWDFNLPQATIDGYAAGFYTEYFGANTYVGKAASGMVVSFDFDCNGKIKQIFVAVDADIL